MSLKKEDSSAIETAIEAFVDIVSRPFAILKPNATHPSLNIMREKNKFGFWAPTIAAVISAVLIALALLLITTDDFDGQYIKHTHFGNLMPQTSDGAVGADSRTRTFVFYIRDVSIIALLVMYSFIFFSVTSKYLKVFDPRISESCKNFLWKARFLVHAPQFLAVFVLMTGGTTVSLIGVYATSIIFLYAAFFPKVLEKRLRNLIVDIRDKMPSDAFMSRQRLEYIHRHKVLGFVYRGWAALNLLLAIFVFAYSFIPSYFLPTIPTDGSIITLAILSSTAIVVCAVVFSTVGAARSYSRETDMRYFNAVDILNREFDWFNGKDGGPGKNEERLANERFYSLEDDPTIDVARSEMTIANQFLQIGKVFRASSSALFAILMGFAAGSITFGFASFAALAFSFGFNDLIDFRSGKDRICHPERPLPRGTVRQRHVVIVLFALVVVLVFSAAMLDTRAIAPIALFFGGIAYSGWFKTAMPIFATPFWCALLAGVISVAMELGLLEGVSIWILVLTREIVFDIRDKDTDFLYNGRMNIALITSSRQWFILSAMIIVGASLLHFAGSDISYVYVLVIGLMLVQFARYLFQIFQARKAAMIFSIVSHTLWPLAFVNVL